MKKRVKFLIVTSILLILLILINHYMSYSMKIGNTQFYLVETMASSNDGKPLLGLYTEVKYGYKGVDMCGFPRFILWNDQYLISKNYNGNDTTIINYVIINRDSVNSYDGEITDIHIFLTEKEYKYYLKKKNISEAEMKQIDNHITWLELLFK